MKWFHTCENNKHFANQAWVFSIKVHYYTLQFFIHLLVCICVSLKSLFPLWKVKTPYLISVCFFSFVVWFFSCVADVSARTVWTSWSALGLLTSSKMSILGAATFASLHSAMETSNSDPTGVPRFKTSSSTTAPWSLYVPPSRPLQMHLTPVCAWRNTLPHQVRLVGSHETDAWGWFHKPLCFNIFDHYWRSSKGFLLLFFCIETVSSLLCQTLVRGQIFTFTSLTEEGPH